MSIPPGALSCIAHLDTLSSWLHHSLWIGTRATGWLCRLPRNRRHPVPGSLGTLSAPPGISDDSGDFTTACRETGQFLWANHKASVKHQVPCPKRLHQLCPKATTFASHCLQPVPGQLGHDSSRSHLCARASAQPPSLPQAELALELNPPALLQFGCAAAFELQADTFYTPANLSLVYAHCSAVPGTEFQVSSFSEFPVSPFPM